MHPAANVPHALGVLGAVGVGVEVAHALPARVLQQLHQVEGVADALGAEAVVLVELAGPLAVEVDVEQLAVPQRLGHGVVEGQARHGLVGELGVEADHLGVLQLADEGQGVADGGQQDVAAGLVGLGLEGEAQVVARRRGRTRRGGRAPPRSGRGPGGCPCRRRPRSPRGRPRARRRWRPARRPRSMASRALATASRRTAGSLAVKAPSLNTGRENRLVVAMGTTSPVSSRASAKRATMASRSDGGRARRHQVVVVEAHAVGAQLGQVLDGVDRVERGPDLVAEGVPARVADGPEAEGEVVLRTGLVVMGHGWLAPGASRGGRPHPRSRPRPGGGVVEPGPDGPVTSVAGVDSSTQSCKVEVRDLDSGGAPRRRSPPPPGDHPAPQRAAPGRLVGGARAPAGRARR